MSSLPAPKVFTPDPESTFVGLVGEAIGFASMCWSETPRGEFDSVAASTAVQAILDRAYSMPPVDSDEKSDAGVSPEWIDHENLRLRELSLSLAHEPGRTRADVLQTAAEYLDFLKGTATEPDKV